MVSLVNQEILDRQVILVILDRADSLVLQDLPVSRVRRVLQDFRVILDSLDF